MSTSHNPSSSSQQTHYSDPDHHRWYDCFNGELVAFVCILSLCALLAFLVASAAFPHCPYCGERHALQDSYCDHCGQQLRITEKDIEQ